MAANTTASLEIFDDEEFEEPIPIEPDPSEDEEEFEEDDFYEEGVTTTEVYNRAYAHFGNAEMAREAAEMYPGDFM